MNRRSLIKATAALGAGLILPPTLAENTEAARRFWALGGMPTTEMITVDVDTGSMFRVGDRVHIYDEWHTVTAVGPYRGIILNIDRSADDGTVTMNATPSYSIFAKYM